MNETSLPIITEFKTVARREFLTLAKAQVIGQLLHAQGYGVRINMRESVTTDAFGNEVSRKTARGSYACLSTDASHTALMVAIADYDDAANAVTVDAVKAKLAEVAGQ